MTLIVDDVQSALKPCPFCGYESETRKVIVYPNGEKSPAFIRCKRCNYHLFGYDYEALVVHWNCRPIENALRDVKPVKRDLSDDDGDKVTVNRENKPNH